MFPEQWYYSMEATVCSLLETLDLEDKYYQSKAHIWPGLDDTIGSTFSAAITGYINIGMAASYNFTLTAHDNAMIFFDDSTTALIDIEGKSSQSRSVSNTIQLSSGRHLMRLYYSNNGDSARLKLTYNSAQAGLPETVVNKVVTFVGGQAPSFLKMKDIMTIVSGAVKTRKPTFTGSYLTSFTVNPALPTGLILNSYSGVISGSCANTMSGAYTITATGPLGSSYASFLIIINGSPLPGIAVKFYNPVNPDIVCYMDSFTESDLTLLVDTVENSINHPLAPKGSSWSSIPGDIYGTFVAMWSGYVYIDVAGDYVFKASHRDGVRMYINYNMVINNWGCFNELVEKEGTVSFDATGYAYIEVTYFTSGNDFGVVLSWKKPNAADFEVIPDSKYAHMPPVSFSYTTSTAQYFRGVTISSNAPVFFGIPSTGYTFTVNPAFPAGLMLQTSGVISGTPSADAEEITYTVTASQGSTQYTTTITFSVTYVAPPTNLRLLDDFDNPVSVITVSQFTRINTVYITADNDPRYYTVQPELPEGLTFNTQSITIMGTPVESMQLTVFTVTAWSSGGSASATLTITVTGCQYGKWFYSHVLASNTISFTLKKKDGEVVFHNDKVNWGWYGMSLCVPQDDYLYTLNCSKVNTCTLKIYREDNIVFLSQQTTKEQPVSGEFSTIVREKPTLEIQQPPEYLALNEGFTLSVNVTGVYKPLYAVPSFPSTMQYFEDKAAIIGLINDKGTFTYDVIAENDAGQSKVTLTFNVGICPDSSKGMITLSRANCDYKESMMITRESTGEEIVNVSFHRDNYAKTLCLPNGDYKVVMRTAQPGGSWSVGSELLVKDVWDDLLASTILDNGKGEKTEYVSINYAIMDRMPMKFYNQAKAPSSKWNQLKFNDNNWSQGDYSSFGNFAANTAYFRKEFNVDSKNKYSILAFDLEIYDGVIVYINGQEVIRRNMPATGVTHESTASSHYDALFWRRTAVPTSALQNGKNVMAVELHRFSDATITLDMYGSLLSGECIKRTDRGKGSDSEHTPSEKYNPAYAFDNNKKTMWKDSNLPVYLQFTYDYDRYEFINKIVLMSGSEYNKEAPKKFDILGISGSEGDVLASIDNRNLFTSSFSTATVYLGTSKAYNAYRIRVDETNDNSNTAGLAEMMLYTCRLSYCPKQKGWAATRTGETVSGSCPRNSFGEASRSCELDKYDPKWSEIDTSNCLSTRPPSDTAYIDFKYMVSNCTMDNFNYFVKDRFINITRDILMLNQESINMFLIHDCSDSETRNACFYMRMTMALDASEFAFSHMTQLQEEMSYRMYTNPPPFFPEGMYFVMVTTPLLRTPMSKVAIIVVVVLVLAIVIGTSVFVYNIRNAKNARKVRGGVNRKSTIENIQDKMERNKKEKAGLLSKN